MGKKQDERRKRRAEKKRLRRDNRMAKKTTKQQSKQAKRNDKAQRQDARRDDKTQRQSQRQAAKGARIDSRQSAKSTRTTARKAKGLAKVLEKGDAGYWSPEAVGLRQATVQGGLDAAGELGSDIISAFGGGSGEPDYLEGGGGYGAADIEEEDDTPITEEPWFLPAVIAAGAGAVYFMSQSKGKK